MFFFFVGLLTVTVVILPFIKVVPFIRVVHVFRSGSKVKELRLGINFVNQFLYTCEIADDEGTSQPFI